MPKNTTQPKIKNIPKLRFPGFGKAWEEKRLGDIIKVERGGSPRPIEKFIVKDEDGIPWIKIGDLKTGVKFVTQTEEKIKFSGVKKSREVFPGDFILSNSMSFGRPYIVKIHGCIHDGWLALRNIEKKWILDNFLYELLQSKTLKKKFLSLAAGSAVKNLKSETVQSAKIAIPNLSEQQKIADFLGGVDEWIENLKKQKESLESYKKGMMQKIFFQKIRFKDEKGEDFPEWEDKGFEQIGEIKTSSVDKKINPDETKVFLLNYMDVYKRNHIYKTDFFQSITAKETQIKTSNLLKGDILFTPSSETPTDIGHSAVIMEDLPNILFSYHLIRFRPRKNILIPMFSGYAFKSFVFYKKLWRLAQGATRFTLSLEAINKVNVNIPESLEEQQKIAEFLSSVDTLIESKQKQITKAEEWKKGLMQGLFV